MVCSRCGKRSYNKYCFNCKPRKPIKYMGKKALQWVIYRKKWLKTHKPNHEGFYICHYCELPVHKDDVTLDHKIARSKRPDLVFVESNIVPAHYKCNSDKGSLDYDKYKKT